MSTYFIDSNGNMQQLIGAIAQSLVQTASGPLSNVRIVSLYIADNVLTLTLNALPYFVGNIPAGTQYMIWCNDDAPGTGQFGVGGPLAFLQGAIITLTTEVVGGLTFTANFPAPNLGTMASQIAVYPGEAAIQIIQGGTYEIANTVMLGTTAGF